MTKKFGFERLAEQLGERVTANVAGYAYFMSDDHPRFKIFGDSPIERLLTFAIHFRLKYGDPVYFKDYYRVTEETLEAKKAENIRDRLLVQNQVDLEGIGRVDFVIHAYATWTINPEGGVPGWRRLIIECDGHLFHERTKEQAARDRSRDRKSVLSGIDVIRFTGSELWNDPLGCADQVVEWADRGA